MMSEVTIHLHDSLEALLYRRVSCEYPLSYRLERRALIKDIVESLGIPHTEIGRLLINSCEVPFANLVCNGDRIEVFGLSPPVDVLSDSMLRPGMPAIRFAVDANVGKLASYLRMAGFDTFYDPYLDDAALACVCEQEKRILLTRDRVLLMRKIVDHGRFIRQLKPGAQLVEVVELYGLRKKLKPFSRCLNCNEELKKVNKDKIVHRLEPLTKKYYHTFRMCPACDKIYWAGSHRERMENLLNTINERIWSS